MNIYDDFSILSSGIIYFDSAATTLKPKMVINEINDYYSKYSSNAHRGDYDIARIVDEKIDHARESIKKFINAKKTEEIVFTSGTTESLNLVIKGFLKKYLKENDEVLTTKAEHASLLLPLFNISKENKSKIKYINLKEDLSLDMDDLKNKINKNTKVIVISHVTNVMGDIRDIKEITKIAHQNNILVIVDAAQSTPHMKIDVLDMDADFLCFSAHKMLGPTGIGVLYGKEQYLKEVDPLIEGGGMNDAFDSLGNVLYKALPEKLEAGTPNISGILGFSVAIDYITKIGIENIHKYEVDLKKYAISKLSKLKNITIYNKDIENGIITFNVDGVFAQDVASYLNKKNICVRVGSHCAKILSEVLGVKNTIRISLYLYNTKEDIDKLASALNNDNILYESL
ncbi:MAG: cysteine desulfurase [Bacilli bacterium]|nr:cysteine desulfurase [Bacilli bacterium]